MESRTISAPREPGTLPVPFPVREGVGTLFILGGGVTPQVMYDEFFRIAGGPRARVIHIPSATITFEEIPDLREYYNEFYEQNPASFGFLHTYDRAVVERREFTEPLNGVTGVWIGGGSQIRLAELFLNTEVVPAIHRVLGRGGIVSGTSCGAAIMSDVMICRGYDPIEFGQGFRLYPRAIVDSHFSGRERANRVARAVLQRPDQIGVGIDEKSALVVHGRRMGVMGLVGKSVWYHFADPAAGKVFRFRLGVGEAAELGMPVQGADPRVLEECLRAIRPAEVFTAAELAEPERP
ncbi:MAG: cyanophycinase [Planctomycetes bacterium]|nr:cyanophycinase [Planctomycetota bacterium]